MPNVLIKKVTTRYTMPYYLRNVFMPLSTYIACSIILTLCLFNIADYQGTYGEAELR